MTELRAPDRIERFERSERRIQYQWVLSSEPFTNHSIVEGGVREILAELTIRYERKRKRLEAVLDNRDQARGNSASGFSIHCEKIMLGQPRLLLPIVEELDRFSARRLESFAEKALTSLSERYAIGVADTVKYFETAQ